MEANGNIALCFLRFLRGEERVSGVSGFWSGCRAGKLWQIYNPYLSNWLNCLCTI